MAARIERLVTSGQFSLDGGTWDVDNNVWIIGDDHEVIVIDAAHDADAIAEAVGDRRLTAIVCTHAHNDHVNAAPALAERTGATIWLHRDDMPLWQQTHPDRDPDAWLTDGQVIEAAGADLTVLHTPGTRPARSACTTRDSAPSSPATPSSRAAPAPPDGPTPTSRPSSTRSATGCWCSRPRRRSAPATGTRPPSEPRRRTWRSGSSAATEPRRDESGAGHARKVTGDVRLSVHPRSRDRKHSCISWERNGSRTWHSHRTGR